MMKYIVLIGIILVLVGYIAFDKFSPVIVRASNNPNFVSTDQFNNVMQNNLNLVWDEINAVKGKLENIDRSLTNINERLSKLEN